MLKMRSWETASFETSSFMARWGGFTHFYHNFN